MSMQELDSHLKLDAQALAFVQGAPLVSAKYYLQAENDRNTHRGGLFIDLIKAAFGVNEVVMVGHHFVFEPTESMQKLDLTKLNEIPSADTMMFDHDIMLAVFGPIAREIMPALAKLPVSSGARDDLLQKVLAVRFNPCQIADVLGLDHTHA